MNLRSGLFLIGFFIALVGCDPVSVQYPPSSVQYPYPNTNNSNLPQPQSAPQVSGSQRFQHAWNKAMEGLAMGGSIGGPYGAGGGLIIGLIAGLITADSYYGAINTQIQSEQQKDQRLEAAIEQELERQRSLENQVATASTPAAGSEPEARPAAQVKQPQSPSANGPRPSKPQENVAVASLGKPASAASPPLQMFKNMEVKDINGDGIPDLWIYYNPQKPGEILRQEEAGKGDGRVDTWSYFKDGKLVRREVDTKGQGRPDTFFYYDGDKIAREERDETGQGRMTYRALYQNDRLAIVEKDTSGRGRPDLWIHYDVSKDGEVVLKEERDLSGDGVADLWTYYEGGRIVRRDVSAIGLEILSKQEQLPAAAADPKELVSNR
jgi:hypothetical protein